MSYQKNMYLGFYDKDDPDNDETKNINMSIIYIDNVTETHYHIKTLGHIKNIRGKTIKFIEHPFQTLHKIPKSEFIKNEKAVTIIDDRILNIFDKYNKFQVKSNENPQKGGFKDGENKYIQEMMKMIKMATKELKLRNDAISIFYKDVIEEINNAPNNPNIAIELEELEEHVKTLDEFHLKEEIHHINAVIIPEIQNYSFSNEKYRQSFLKKWEDLRYEHLNTLIRIGQIKKNINDALGVIYRRMFLIKLDEAKADKKITVWKGGFTDKLAKDFMKNWKATKDMIKKNKKKNSTFITLYSGLIQILTGEYEQDLEQMNKFKKDIEDYHQTDGKQSAEDYNLLINGIKINMDQRNMKMDIIMKMINDIRNDPEEIYTTINIKFKDNILEKLHDSTKNFMEIQKNFLKIKEKLDILDVKRFARNKKNKKRRANKKARRKERQEKERLKPLDDYLVDIESEGIEKELEKMKIDGIDFKGGKRNRSLKTKKKRKYTKGRRRRFRNSRKKNKRKYKSRKNK